MSNLVFKTLFTSANFELLCLNKNTNNSIAEANESAINTIVTIKYGFMIIYLLIWDR